MLLWRDATEEEIRSILVGFYLKIGIDDVNKLKQNGYPSLFMNGILFGPLSLVNHECRVARRFTNTFTHKIYGFEEMRVVRIKKQDGGWKKGKEITVNYGFSFLIIVYVEPAVIKNEIEVIVYIEYLYFLFQSKNLETTKCPNVR